MFRYTTIFFKLILNKTDTAVYMIVVQQRLLVMHCDLDHQSTTT